MEQPWLLEQLCLGGETHDTIDALCWLPSADNKGPEDDSASKVPATQAQRPEFISPVPVWSARCSSVCT